MREGAVAQPWEVQYGNRYLSSVYTVSGRVLSVSICVFTENPQSNNTS